MKLKPIWLRATILEAMALGVAFGGWAESTYWHGCGYVVGVTVGVFSLGALAILRDGEDEKRRNGEKRSASPYGKVGRADRAYRQTG